MRNESKKKVCLTFFSSRKEKENIYEWEMITSCEKIKKHNKNKNKIYFNKYLV